MPSQTTSDSPGTGTSASRQSLLPPGQPGSDHVAACAGDATAKHSSTLCIPGLTAVVIAFLFLFAPVAAEYGWSTDSTFITPDFRLHDPDPTLLRRVPRLAADTIGNFYAIWRQGINEGGGVDGKVVVTKVRYDGTVEKAFVTIACDTTPGFNSVPEISVDPAGTYFVVTFSRFYYGNQNPGLAAAIPPVEHAFIQIFDSSGTALTPELWADSALQQPKVWGEGVLLTSNVIGACWQGDGNQKYLGRFSLLGQKLDPVPPVIDSCETMDCAWSQGSRSDGYRGGFVVTWDEAVFDFGPSEQRPVFRVFDSLGLPATPVMIGAHQEGYEADCGASAPGYQSGYQPDVAMADNGEFMLVWSSCDGQYLDPWGAKPWGQIYNGDGTTKTGLLLLADSPPGYAPFIHVAWSTHDGNYYAAWGDSRDCTPCIGPRNVYVQKISPEGNLLGANYIVNDVVGSLVGTYAVDIAVSRDRACIIWQDKSNYAVYPDGEMFGEVVSLDLVGTYLAGDVNMDYQCTSADVIYLVNYVFKSGQRPLPGKMFGDVNGDCVTTSADIIYYVNFVFKGGPGLVEACSN